MDSRELLMRYFLSAGGDFGASGTRLVGDGGVFGEF
jgi:hypothetical protein